MQGIIKALRDGFGFVTMEGSDKDMFFHANNMEGVEFNDLQMGQTLSYELGEGRDGRQQAINVPPNSKKNSRDFSRVFFMCYERLWFFEINTTSSSRTCWSMNWFCYNSFTKKKSVYLTSYANSSCWLEPHKCETSSTNHKWNSSSNSKNSVTTAIVVAIMSQRSQAKRFWTAHT